ncbi:MAG TPA: hypothetical protein VL614_29090, partial [Acetobacteraceae bacterium]|nr:hypothetical protein [Acetobacteraceae bacterium]
RPGPDGVLWIPTETALNRWGKVKDAALAGMCVVLTERGWPLIQLVPTTTLQTTMRLVTGRTGSRGRKAKPAP